MLPLNTLRWGHDAPQPERHILRAGPLTALFEDGGLRYIRLGDREVLRRIYVAVRDHNWDTIPLAVSDLRIEQGDHGFRLTFQADHRKGAIDFGWRGTITGDAWGTITFAMDGAARSTFLRNRIGFCVLHPPATHLGGYPGAGYSCVVEHDDGTRVTDEFPAPIAPHQPFVEIRAIAHQLAPDLWAEVRLAGDIFEMEDQRNWTDASYKTYCTPLRLPFPVEIAAGETVVQSVTLSLSGGGQVPVDGDQGVAGTVVTVGDEPLGRLPRLGHGDASHGQPLGAADLARLRALNLAHLRVDLRLSGADWRARLARAAADAQALDADLECAITLSDAGEAEIVALVAALAELRPPVVRWLVYHEQEKVTAGRWIALARHLKLPDLQPATRRDDFPADAPGIAGGTDAYFTELNRDRPAPGSLDLVAYSINPQVHAFDDASLVETLPMQAATVESARRFLGDIPVAISPVTLLPRFNPNATGPRVAPDPTLLPPEVDPRQLSLFAAAWTVGSLAALAGARVASATYYETTGPRGLMETAAGAPWPAFPSIPGAAFPVYHVFAALAPLRDGAVLPVVAGDHLRAAALAVRHVGRTHVLLANLLPAPQAITLRVAGARATLRLLDETTALAAMESPETFRASPGEPLPIADGALTLDLLPYAVAELAVE